MNYVELSKYDFAKYDEINGAKIENKHSESKESDVFTAVFNTENLGEIRSDEFPTFLTCKNFVEKTLQRASDIENEKENWQTGDDDGD